MKTLKFSAISLVILGGFLLLPLSTFAAVPSLSLTTFSNSQVQIAVNGDPNSSVNLYYYSPGTSFLNSVGNIGSTNGSGYFSTIISNGTYNIPSGANTYVSVNGQQSNQVSWPYTNGNNNGSISFSQNNINLSYGQSTTVTVYGGSGSYYISSNSNPNFVNAYVSGNQVYVSAPNNQYTGGSATIVVCSNGNGACGSLYVNQGGGSYNQVTFSQNNLSVNVGQGVQVSIYGSGSYYISNNSNPNAVSTNINGSVLNVYGNNSGSATITVCTNGGVSGCGTLYVNVVNNGYYGGGTNGCYYSNGYYNCPNNNYNYNNNGCYISNGYNICPNNYNNNGVVYTQPTTSGIYGTPSAGVFLNQVPATGAHLDLKVILFFSGLFMWSAFLAYLYFTHRKFKAALAREEIGY
ncbi:MAG TPA: hypothetical protein VFA52_00375 [Candidatus Paceibacterota bacterium]|nr:hypothetical protein [Candidatus Paceibacterota bacterium]